MTYSDIIHRIYSGVASLYFTDDGGRYAYDQQPSVCRWNLFKLAEALSPIIQTSKMKEILDATYDSEYEKHFTEIMRKKVLNLKLKCCTVKTI